MKKEEEYIQDIAEIRTLMERSSKFMSLSGWAGILAGIYALVATYIAYAFFKFNPGTIHTVAGFGNLANVIVLALCVLVLSIGTAIFLSIRRAAHKKERIWNPTSRRLIANVAVPLVAGGLLILVFISKGLIAQLAPLTLLFYGIALFTAGNHTYRELKYFGIALIGLGLVGSYRTEYGLLLWAIGFGLLHIVYGIYIHVKHER